VLCELLQVPELLRLCAFQGGSLQIRDIRATILECWWTEASTRDPENIASLKAFADSKPDWDVVVQLSEDIVQKYVATTEGLSMS
jgi:hypothetical protein